MWRGVANSRKAALFLAAAAILLVIGILTVSTRDFGALTRTVGPAAQRAGVSLLELRPTDESLESVFSYLVRR